MVQDLAEFSIGEVEAAITAYRQQVPAQGKTKYFPDSGTLRKLASEERAHRRSVAAAPVQAEWPGRPIKWWMQSKRIWRHGWLESDVPAGESIRDEPGAPLREPARVQ